MSVDRALRAAEPTLSFEFFPPKSEASARKLMATFDELARVRPDFVSVTYGAGGSTRETTLDTVVELNRRVETVAHLTCVGHTVAEVDRLLDTYHAAGVTTILALGGDLPADGSLDRSDFRFAADLVAHIRSRGDFAVGVAAHPEVHPRSPDRADDRRRLAEKLEAADFAVTQFFFEVEHYARLLDELAELGVAKPVVPGVIPVTNPTQVQRFAQLAGASLPAWLTEGIDACGDDLEAVRSLGIRVAAELADALLDAGAPGVHLYSLNQSGPALEVVDRIAAFADRRT